MRYLVAALLSFALAGPASAALTTTNLGNGSTRLRFDYVVPTAKLAEIRDAICSQVDRGDEGTCLEDIDLAVRDYLRGLLKQGRAKVASDLYVKPIIEADVAPDFQ